MTTTIKAWTHPTTKEVRVYVNDPRLWRGVKLFFFLNEIGKLRTVDYTIQGGGQARAEAEEVANEIGQACGGEWDALLAMANNN